MTLPVHAHYMPSDTLRACAVYAVRLLFHSIYKTSSAFSTKGQMIAYRTTQRPTKISLKMEIITHRRKRVIWNIIVDAKKNEEMLQLSTKLYFANCLHQNVYGLI